MFFVLVHERVVLLDRVVMSVAEIPKVLVCVKVNMGLFEGIGSVRKTSTLGRCICYDVNIEAAGDDLLWRLPVQREILT
jgi:hypothetical protein